MEKQVIKNENRVLVNEFVKLSDLTGKDVKTWSRVPVKLSRRITRNGINATMQIVINQINLVIPITSTEVVNGVTRRMRFYKPERLVSLIFDLGLPQVDERGLDITEWTFNAPIRFVKGKTQSGDEYFQIEVLFKQYKYESVFLNSDQVSILNSLEKAGQLKDYRGNNININWETRPEILEDITEDIFEF